MNIETFEIINSILYTILLFLATFVFPRIISLIKLNTTEKQRNNALYYGNIAIQIAEGLYNERNQGVEKKEYVKNRLNELGIKISQNQFDALVEMIVAFYNSKGWGADIKELV